VVDIAPILVSGGLDMSVVTTPAALPSSTIITKVINPIATSVETTFEESYQRKVPYAIGPSSSPSVRVARQARLLVCMHDMGVSIWKILPKKHPEDEVDLSEEEVHGGGWEKILDMDLNVHTNLVASAISDDGQWLAVSDMYETKLFTLFGDSKVALRCSH